MEEGKVYNKQVDKHIEYYNSEKINASIKAKRDAEERKAKMKR